MLYDYYKEFYMATKKFTIKDLCLNKDPRMYSDPEPSYEFTNRKFTKNSGNVYSYDDDDDDE